MSKRLAKRSSLGVGKEIGGCIYLHKKYEHLLPQAPLDRAIRYLYYIAPAFVYNVIKFDKLSHRFTFFSSLDFDISHEPTAGYYISIAANGEYHNRVTDRIWHHKWMFVGDDYTRFNVEESRERSEWWTNLPIEINRSKIGNPVYWNELMSKYKEP